MRASALLLTLLGGSALFFGCQRMTATNLDLPVRRVLLQLSQSNGARTADAKGMEDANPQLAIRSPAATATSTSFTHGEVRDELVMPDPEFGAYRTINYRGRGLMNVRYLTFFNPVSTCLERTGTTGIQMPTYPGKVEVASVSSSRTFKTKMMWQYSPVGKVTLTRLRNGATHTIAAITSTPGTEITVGESFDPPLEVGERFTHTIAAGANSANPSTVAFYNRYGGNHDLGGIFEPTLDGLSGDYPNGVEGGYIVSLWEVTFAAGTPGAVTCLEHAVFVGRKIRFKQPAGTLPVELATGTDYYIVRIDSTTPTKFYIAATPDGAELSLSAATGTFQMCFMPDGRDSTLAGMNLRCLTGANAGEVRPLGAITQSGLVWTCSVTEPFSNNPAQDDTFEIEPPDVEGAAVPWEKWAYFLPHCPFEGREQGLPAQIPVTITTGATTTFQLIDPSYSGFYGGVGVPIHNGAPVRVYRKINTDATPTPSGEVWPSAGLTEGRIYYVVNVNESTYTFQLSATYDGTPITVTGTTGQTHWLDMADTWLQKHNPAPPGFNHVNMGAIPYNFQPYRGAVMELSPEEPKASYHWLLAQRLSEFYGEDIYVVNLSVAGTSLSQVQVPSTTGFGIGWYDPTAMTHWSPSPTALRARVSATLDAAQLAATREGVRLEIIGIVWVQGESDGNSQDRADRYYDAERALKKSLRAEIKTRGMWPRDADEIPFFAPKVRTSTTGYWPFSATVNAAKERAASEDPFARTFSTDTYTLYDEVHYDGASASVLAQTLAALFIEFAQRDDVPLRISQLALKLAGERSDITSVFPGDGSEEAALCSTFYRVARDTILESHAWDFLVRQATLTQTTSERTDWLYAYDLPDNFGGVIALGDDIMSAFDSRAVKIKFSIELTTQSKRVLYANQPPPLAIRYKTKTADPSMFSPTCEQAIATYMASMIVAATLKGEEGIKASAALEQKAMSMFRTSAAHDANFTRDRSQPRTLGWRR